MNDQDSIDRRFLGVAQWFARYSPDPSTKVGAAIVRRDGTLAATGYNRFPPGFDQSPYLYADRAFKYQHIIHAEIMALDTLHEAGETPEGFTVYTSFPCCPDCLDRLGKAGITRAVSPEINTLGRTLYWVEEWKARLEVSAQVAKRYGIELEVLDV